MTAGSDLIAAERERQIAVEGWTPDHDDEHDTGELTAAAIEYAARAYALTHLGGGNHDAPPSALWPWDASWWKPGADPIANLVKAGALVAAEIDRLVRAERGSSGE